jgi:ribonuclease HI
MNFYIASNCQPNPTLNMGDSKPKWGTCGWGVLAVKPGGELLSAKTFGHRRSTLDVSELEAMVSALYIASGREEKCTIYSSNNHVVDTVLLHAHSWQKSGLSLSPLPLIRQAFEIIQRIEASIVYVEEPGVFHRLVSDYASKARIEIAGWSS